MNGAQLSAQFQAHKPAVLGTAAAVVAGLAVLQKKKAAAGAATSTTGGGAPVRTAGATVPAAAVTSGSGYDSSITDLYNALSPQLEAILQTTGRNGITSAPTPTSSALLTPGGYYAGGANYYKTFGDGTVDALTMDEYQAAGAPQLTQLTKDDPFWTQGKLVGDGTLGYRPMPAAAGYYAAGANYYEGNGDGTARPLTMDQYVSAGKPTLTQVGRDSSFLANTSLIGGGTPTYRDLP